MSLSSRLLLCILRYVLSAAKTTLRLIASRLGVGGSPLLYTTARLVLTMFQDPLYYLSVGRPHTVPLSIIVATSHKNGRRCLSYDVMLCNLSHCCTSRRGDIRGYLNQSIRSW